MSDKNVGLCLSVVADVTLFVLMYAVVNFNMHSNLFLMINYVMVNHTNIVVVHGPYSQATFCQATCGNQA